MSDIDTLFDSLESHLLAMGRFDSVNLVEPKSEPGSGLTAAVWIQDVRPAPRASTLDMTAIRFEFSIRLYTSMLSGNQDLIDPNLVEATDELLENLNGDFTLDGAVQAVDVLGIHGPPLQARAGFLTIAQTMYRVMTLAVPLIVTDAYTQTP